MREESSFCLNKLPKIALIVDSDSWAFANIAKKLVENLNHKYEFIVIPSALICNVHQILLMTEGYDIVHFFWRDLLNHSNSEECKNNLKKIGFDVNYFFDRFLNERNITTSVYDHLFLSESEIISRTKLFNEMVKGYTVSSQRLFKIYSDINVYPEPMKLTEDGVDLSIFRPINIERFDKILDRKMVIGWAGNSKWSSESGEDFKGFHSILKPAVDELVAEGLNITLHTADRQHGFIKHIDMPNFYSKLDVYVCPSKIEGTPNPVLEAMACGVPVISTDVGVVPQAFGDDKYSMKLEERSVECLKKKISSIYNSRNFILKQISIDNLEKIKTWDWSLKSKNFESFFDSILGLNKK